MSSTMTSERLHSIRSLAEFLDISEWTVRRLAKAGTIQYRRIAGQIRFTSGDVETYLRKCAAKPIKKGKAAS